MLALNQSDVMRALVHQRLGVRALEKRDFDDAIRLLERSVTIADLSTNYDSLGYAYFQTGEIKKALDTLRKTHSPIGYQNKAFCAQFSSTADVLREAVESVVINGFNKRSQLKPYENLKDKNRKIRVGYVSSYFREHVQSYYTLPVLKNRSDKFEVYLYSNTRSPDTKTFEHLQNCEVFKNVGYLTDEQLAETIQEDLIDVLVDLNMHMSGRLGAFAYSPAPIQVCWLAYPGTTGLKQMQYRLTDPYIDRPENFGNYSEKSIYLSNSFWCYNPEIDIEVNELPAKNNASITFGCLNSFSKQNIFTFSLFSNVLTAVEGSKLILLAPEGNSRTKVLNFFSEMNINSDRIEFVDHQSREEYFKTFNRIDISLDTIPYQGHTTSMDSWYMGVPVLSLSGKTVVGRAAYSQCSNLGLTEWCAHSPKQFVYSAKEFTANLEALSFLRRNLRGLMLRSPLMDTVKFTKDLEIVYKNLFAKWCSS